MNNFIFKTRIFFCVILLAPMYIYAELPPKLIMATDEKDGQVLSKQSFKWDISSQSYKPDIMREYLYFNNGLFTANKTYHWNKRTSSWEIYSEISYEYDKQLNTVTLLYSVWNKSKKSFEPPKQKIIYTLSENDKITNYKQMKKNELNDNWMIDVYYEL